MSRTSPTFCLGKNAAFADQAGNQETTTRTRPIREKVSSGVTYDWESKGKRAS